jgi:hypothetical protein
MSLQDESHVTAHGAKVSMTKAGIHLGNQDVAGRRGKEGLKCGKKCTGMMMSERRGVDIKRG